MEESAAAWEEGAVVGGVGSHDVRRARNLSVAYSTTESKLTGF